MLPQHQIGGPPLNVSEEEYAPSLNLSLKKKLTVIINK